MIAGIGAVVPGALAYKWFAVIHISNFFLWGTDTEISLTTSSTGSSAAFVLIEGAPFVLSTSTLRFLCAGSLPNCKLS